MNTCSHCHRRAGYWVTFCGLLCSKCMARTFPGFVYSWRF